MAIQYSCSSKENQTKTTARIDLPRNWVNFIRMVSRNLAIKVIELVQENIIAFNQLLSTIYVHKKQNSEGEPMWSKFAAKELTPIAHKLFQLPEAKVKNLKSFLEFVHPTSCTFYESLILCNEQETFSDEADTDSD
ncbi:hypothetical protein PR048_017204 [Dryococelus australis]|uniref:Uncharacterized protein n=1 Tax=Dryococelus australis TaxID=614101 RepID=A0ABQ9H8W0_9NEOP|nr:hypothetical protein PR048_017204 [Dryococelus australis]